MLEVSYDIEAINIYVTVLVEQLAARGEGSSDLLINVFAACVHGCPRQDVRRIHRKTETQV